MTVLNIRQALPSEYDAVCAFYDSLIDAMQSLEYHPRWKKGIYPEYEVLELCIDRGELFVGLCGDCIVAAMVLNHSFNDGYAHVSWPTPAEPEETFVIHMLGVHPAFGRHGYARQLVRFAIDRAHQSAMKVVRLDVLEGNLPAERLYVSEGFRYVETLPMYYEDTGRVNFLLYEYPLKPKSPACVPIAGLPSR